MCRLSVDRVHGQSISVPELTGACSQLGVSTLPECSPVTAAAADQALGFSCLPGSVTTTPHLVRPRLSAYRAMPAAANYLSEPFAAPHE